MQKYFPSWVERFGSSAVPIEYLTSADRFHWYKSVLPDKQRLTYKSGEYVLEYLFARSAYYFASEVPVR